MVSDEEERERLELTREVRKRWVQNHKDYVAAYADLGAVVAAEESLRTPKEGQSPADYLEACLLARESVVHMRETAKQVEQRLERLFDRSVGMDLRGS